MVIVVGVLFTIVALISLFGYGVRWPFCSAPRKSDTSPDMRRFIGSISRNRRFVKAYSALMWLVFFISLAASGLFLYVIYSGKALLRDCSTTDTQGNTTTEQCDLHPSVWMKVVVTVAVFCHLMLHLCASSSLDVRLPAGRSIAYRRSRQSSWLRYGAD